MTKRCGSKQNYILPAITRDRADVLVCSPKRRRADHVVREGLQSPACGESALMQCLVALL